MNKITCDSFVSFMRNLVVLAISRKGKNLALRGIVCQRSLRTFIPQHGKPVRDQLGRITSMKSVSSIAMLVGVFEHDWNSVSLRVPIVVDGPPKIVMMSTLEFFKRWEESNLSDGSSSLAGFLDRMKSVSKRPVRKFGKLR